MDGINIYDFRCGKYSQINEENREQFKVEFSDNILAEQRYLHEYLNPGQNYILYMDYDDGKLTVNECVHFIMQHLKAHGIPATESMIKTASKWNSEKKYHFAIPSLYATVEEQKIFWQGLGFPYDTSVFRKGWFRLPNQKKPSSFNKPAQETVYRPVGDAKLNDFILGNIPWYSKNILTYKPKLDDIQPVISNMTKSESFDSESVVSSSASSLEGGFYEHSDDTKIKILVHILSNLQPEYYNDYEKWMKVGTILKGALGDDSGFQLFIWFSKKSNKYPGQKFVWQHWKNWNEEKITFGSFKFMVGPEVWKTALALGKIDFVLRET